MQKKTASRLDELQMREFAESLFEANTPYAEIAQVIQDRTGETISDSALSRAYQKWQRKRMAADAIEREVEAVMKALEGKPDLDLKQSVLGLFWKKFGAAFAEAGASFERADALEMSHLLMKAIRTEQTAELLGVQKDRLELMRQKVERVADKVKDRLTQAGASKEEIVQTVDEILGVTA